MAAFYQSFTAIRTTEPDPISLLSALRTIDVTIGVQHELGSHAYRLKKNTDWTAPQITAAQTVIETTVVQSAQTLAQADIAVMGIATKALLLVILDELNRLRQNPTTVFPAITPAQVLQAVRDKAGTL